MADYRKDIFKILKSLRDNDFYIDQFTDGGLREEIIYALSLHNIIWITSDDRVLLTKEGETYLFHYLFSVENIKKQRKLKEKYE